MIKLFTDEAQRVSVGRIPTWRLRANNIFARLNAKVRLRHPMDEGDMMNMQCKSNLYHLLSSVKWMNVQGAAVDIGCYDGANSSFIQLMMNELQLGQLGLYDNFVKGYGREVNKHVVNKNFAARGLGTPLLTEGDFYDTLPAQLPPQIAFAHIDCGWGGDVDVHEKLILHILQAVYPHLATHAVVVLMDYNAYQPAEVWNVNPGVRKACDKFFADKQEKITELYGGYFSQGFFRKL